MNLFKVNSVFVRCLFYLLTLFIIHFNHSCKGNVLKDENSKFEKVNHTNSSLRDKSIIKDEMLTLYPQLLSVQFNIDDGIDYSNYQEFKEMEVLIDEYDSHKLTNNEIQLLGIFKAKIYLLLSNYAKAIKVITELPRNNEYSMYKELLVAISKDYSESEDALDYYKKLITDVTQAEILECSRYLMLMVLVDKKDFDLCKNNNMEEYEQLLILGKDKMIENYILGLNKL